MTINSGAGIKFMEELPLGIHTLAEGTPDTIMLALYGPNASLTPSHDSYTTSGEVVGGGYSAGGVAVPLIIVGRSGSARAGGLQFPDGPYIQPVDDTAIAVTGVGIRGCMLYNASQSNRNIFTLDFGQTLSPSVGLTIAWGVGGVVTFSDTLIQLLGKSS